MTLKDTLLRATVGAAMLALSGGAYAADTAQSTPSTPAEPPAMTAPGAGGGADMKGGADVKGGADLKGGPDANVGGKAGASLSAKPEIPPKTIVGKDVVNTKGEKIGEVEKISGDQVVVSSGGFLGIGSHDVAIPWSQVTMVGTGDDAKLELSLSKDELKQMPEYKEPKSSTGATGGGAGMGGAGGGTGGGTQ